jgi:hypothetical protein
MRCKGGADGGAFRREARGGARRRRRILQWRTAAHLAVEAGAGRSRRGEGRCSDGRSGEGAVGGFIWGEMEKKRKKEKLKLENLQKNPILSYDSSFDRFSVPRQPDNGARCQKSC